LLDSKAPNILSRSRKLLNINTGFRLIDSMFPIGLGQRQLIIGDKNTGKTTLAISILLNQNSKTLESLDSKSIYSIYVATAMKCSTMMRFYELLFKNITFNFSIVFASITDSIGNVFISTLSGTTLSEYFRNKGMHSIVIYDDLSKHAIFFRQLSLSLRNPSGREAFPSNIFFLHAKLLERSCCLNATKLNGSLTSFPIIETLQNDLSAFIATNIISITDGQLFIDSNLFGLGIFPSISIEKSVSRIGAKALDKF
jgi:proton translocating ATP synthase F1 alpha subunit